MTDRLATWVVVATWVLFAVDAHRHLLGSGSNNSSASDTVCRDLNVTTSLWGPAVKWEGQSFLYGILTCCTVTADEQTNATLAEVLRRSLALV